MDKFFNGKSKYLFLAPLALMVMVALYFQNALTELQRLNDAGITAEKEIILSLSVDVDGNSNSDPEDKQSLVTTVIEQLTACHDLHTAQLNKQINKLSVGIVAQLLITTTLNIIFVFLLSYLGYIYASRKKPKWRSKL